jgi:hypothetical protein
MVDWSSFFLGAGGTVVILVLGILFLVSLVMGRARTEIKFLLTKIFSRLSLMLIAITDVVAAFDPTQTLLGLGIAPIAGILVFLAEFILHDKMDKTKFFPALFAGLIAAFIVMLPFPIAGIFVAWYGVMGDKKKQA